MSDSESRRVAVVTGAARGIGRACAILLARSGLAVALLDRRAEALHGLAAELSAAGQTAVAITLDLSDADEIEALPARVHEVLGPVDVLVHCAGVILPHGFAESTPEQLDAMMAVNLRAVFLVSRVLLADLKAQRGTIVTIASTAGLHPQFMNGPYCVAKAGVVMLSRALAQELLPDGVRVNCVCPGGVDTPLIHEYAVARGQPESIQQLRTSGFLSEPEEIAAAVLWLVGEGARAVTGQVLAVDHGALLGS